MGAARILVSTRLYPADLQTVTGEAGRSCVAKFLRGLSDDDALNLWRAFGVSGSRELLLPLFNRVGNHPLLIQSLASEVARYRAAPGDFDCWEHDHPDFDPFSLPLVRVKSHVLEFALGGLEDKARQALSTIAAFRMPASYDTLTSLLVGEAKPYSDERALDAVLAELEDRGLVGWDKRANRYDLHPIVRGVIWRGLGDDARHGVYSKLHAHFESVPVIDDYLQVNRLEDLTPTMELYNTLIGLRRYDDAGALLFGQFGEAMVWRLSASQQLAELLEMLFPDGLDQLPHMSNPADQGFALNALALAFHLGGQPGRAALFYQRFITISSESRDYASLNTGLSNLAGAFQQAGLLYQAQAAVHRSLVISREQKDGFSEGCTLDVLGLTLVTRGMAHESMSAWQRSLRMFVAQNEIQLEGSVNSHLAQRAVRLGALVEAQRCANRAWEVAHVQNLERDFIRAARVQGAAALGLHDFAEADERLHHALTRARQVNHTEEELPALVALAELRRQEAKRDEAHELLDDVWEPADRGPYPLFHADAFNFLLRSNATQAISTKLLRQRPKRIASRGVMGRRSLITGDS